MLLREPLRFEVRYSTLANPSLTFHSSHDDLIDAGLVADVVIDDIPSLTKIVVVDTLFVDQEGKKGERAYTIAEIDEEAARGDIARARRIRERRARRLHAGE